MARPIWTRRTYEMAAQTVFECLRVVDTVDSTEALELAANGLANQFAADYPRFDRQKFLSACGFGEK